MAPTTSGSIHWMARRGAGSQTFLRTVLASSIGRRTARHSEFSANALTRTWWSCANRSRRRNRLLTRIIDIRHDFPFAVALLPPNKHVFSVRSRGPLVVILACDYEGSRFISEVS